MYYTRLALEVRLSQLGFDIISPPFLSGKSGVAHQFTLLAKNGPRHYGFDICERVGAIEVLRAYIKTLDTGALAFIVSLEGRPTDEAKELASLYGIRILESGETESLFSKIPVPESTRNG